jgi:hypothetical protein
MKYQPAAPKFCRLAPLLCPDTFAHCRLERKNSIAVRFVAQRVDVSIHAFAGVDHYGSTHWFEFPIEQAGIEFLSFLGIAATDFELNYPISHLVSFMLQEAFLIFDSNFSLFHLHSTPGARKSKTRIAHRVAL